MTGGDDTVWRLLTERASGRRPPSDDAAAAEFRRVSGVRLLDAAIGVLAATRELVAVGEDILRQQRERLAAPPDGADATSRRPRAESQPETVPLTY